MVGPGIGGNPPLIHVNLGKRFDYTRRSITTVRLICLMQIECLPATAQNKKYKQWSKKNAQVQMDTSHSFNIHNFINSP